MHPIWTPTPTRAQASGLARFMRVMQQRGIDATDYDRLWHWSVTCPGEFWEALYEFADVVGERGDGPALENPNGTPGVRWFSGARLNFAENLLRHSGPGPALIGRDESGARREISWDQLAAEVARIADGLRSAGIGVGDCVAGYMPNVPETVIAMLATASIGATWTSCSSDFGVQGVIDRFGQIAPKALFIADGYRYAGKRIDCRGKIAEIVGRIESLSTVVIVPFLDAEPTIDDIPHAGLYGTFGQHGAVLRFERLPFDHPLYVLYSSGTTGIPKCIVHGAGGTLLQHLKEHQLHTDVRHGDRLFFFTTCGWMMWNWLASGLASGAALILYEGSPLSPDEGVLWRLAEEERVDIFGTSPRYLSALEKSGYHPRDNFALTRLRTVLSTGSPLAPEQYDFVHDHVGADVQLASISGGTDIVSCFVLGNPVLPVYRGEIQCRGLGMNVQVWDDDGKAIVDEKGELVCTTPFPSMPIGFWNDPDGAKYRAAYFDRFPGVWHHGDYALLTGRGGLVLHGRSDAVLNPGGVRIGTAEIYRQVEQVDEVLESVVVGQDWQGDVRVVLFVRLQDGLQLDESLIRRIREQIRTNTTPRHVPARILQVSDVPRTASGKVVELAVRHVIHGRTVANVESISNPQSLEQYRDRPELQS